METVTVPVAELASRFEELMSSAQSHKLVIVVDADGRRLRLIPAPNLGERPVVAGLHPNVAGPAPNFHVPLPGEAWEGAFD
jgi:hypothetical protein